MSRNKKATPGTAKRVLGFLKPYRLFIILSLLLSAVTVAVTLALPYIFGNAIDMILGAGITNLEGIKSELINSAILIVICAVATWLMNTANNRITLSVAREIRNKAYDKINALPVGYIDAHPTGDTVSQIINDTERFTDGLLMGFTQLFSGVLTILGTLVFMFTISWKIGLAVFVLTPLSLFVAKFIASHTHKYFKAQSETLGEETAFVNETLSEAKIVKAFGEEENCGEKFREINERLNVTALKSIFFSSLTNPATRFVNALVYAAVAFIGAVSVITGGGFTVGMLSCMLSYANQYTKPFNEISGVITELQNALACAERIIGLLDAEEEAPGEGAESFTAKGGVEFRDIVFSYDKAKPVINGLSLRVQSGQRVAIVGHTGCGKTTLINLLMRFYDAHSGEILLDGERTDSMQRKALRRNFGMVLQDTYLMAGTVRENITMGNDFADEDIIKASKASHAWSFIKRLPEGLDTVITEAGGNLSAGQKQLLCITRVMLADPTILLLDEATSSIDTNTEIRVQKAFDTLMQGRTSFIVAHRLSTIVNADLIVVMDAGRIIEKGTHAELIALDGEYAAMIRAGLGA